MSFFKRLFGKKDAPQTEEQVEEKKSLDEGLKESKKGVLSRIAKVFTGKRKIDEDLLEDDDRLPNKGGAAGEVGL